MRTALKLCRFMIKMSASISCGVIVCPKIGSCSCKLTPRMTTGRLFTVSMPSGVIRTVRRPMRQDSAWSTVGLLIRPLTPSAKGKGGKAEKNILETQKVWRMLSMIEIKIQQKRKYRHCKDILTQ